MNCVHCDKPKRIVSGGLCSACYSRLRRRGTVEKKNISNFGRACIHDGCEQPAFAKGLCSRHYVQQQHPMKGMWALLRSANPDRYPPAWDDFDIFVQQIGERPSGEHQLRRIDVDEPYSVENVKWVSYAIDIDEEDETKTRRQKYARAWQLERKYKISVKRYDELLDEQGGVCAMCREPETFVNKKTGKLQDLCVDHNHTTGEPRGLLCVRCNRGLGYLRDDPALLRAGVVYLKKYSVTIDDPPLTSAEQEWVGLSAHETARKIAAAITKKGSAA